MKSSALLLTWIEQLKRRQSLFPDLIAAPEQTLRLIDDKDRTGYACDKLGDRLWFYRFRDTEMDAQEQQAIELFASQVGLVKTTVRQMSNRGQSPEIKIDEEILWIASEGPARYQLAAGRGWSPGLFLDQRDNRKWVHDNSSGKQVLNLFCYTGGFSINAALGGAAEVVSVDTSKQTLEWCKENFLLNDLPTDTCEFRASDARNFLAGCARRQRKFDLIICDPPSFARSKQSVFKIDKDAPELVQACLSQLNPDGRLLFACNYEQWSGQDLLELATAWAQPFRPGSIQLLPRTLDYAEDAPMKSVLISCA